MFYLTAIMCIFHLQEVIYESFQIYGHMTKMMHSFKGTAVYPSLPYTEKTQMRKWLTEVEREEDTYAKRGRDTLDILRHFREEVIDTLRDRLRTRQEMT